MTIFFAVLAFFTVFLLAAVALIVAAPQMEDQ